jgi:DNA mismatch repair protein MutL
MSDIIHLLPDHVANQIAAGEVVQRPASVVKELLENAIDAKADTIKLIIKDAGKKLVQVIDNGIGMSETDARLSFERHATSKIKSAEDLFNLQTKGFRGEALASIAAIAQVELKTRQENQDLGVLLKIEGSKITKQELISTPKGTSIAVKNLFFNIPARRNFLKSNTVETRHIIDEFQRVALAHPSIAFSLYHNDNQIYHLPSQNLRKRIVGIFGERINDKLVPINETTDIVSIKGFVTSPKFAKKTRGEQFFFANNRFIKSNYLNHAILNAYEGLLAPKYYPSYFIFLDVPANSIDINIHPTKTEVKFENESAIYSFIRSTVKHSLGQYNVSPVLDFERNDNLDLPYSLSQKNKKDIPKINVNPNFNPFKNNNSDNVDSSYTYKKETSNWDALFVDSDDKIIDDLNSIPVEIESDFSQTNLFNQENLKPENKTFQINNRLIASNLKNSLLLVKQHLAHQRILFEDYLKKISDDAKLSQQLLIPLEIEFAKHDVAILFENKQELEEIGFKFVSFNSDGIVLNGIPININQDEILQFLEQLIDDIRLEIPKKESSFLEYICKNLAVKNAIKSGKQLNSNEQEHLINQLFSCKEPNFSPNGKKIFIHLSFDEIEQKFN